MQIALILLHKSKERFTCIETPHPPPTYRFRFTNFHRVTSYEILSSVSESSSSRYGKCHENCLSPAMCPARLTVCSDPSHLIVLKIIYIQLPPGLNVGNSLQIAQ